MSDQAFRNRRQFLRGAAVTGAVLLSACGRDSAQRGQSKDADKRIGNAGNDISPVEDLMREHGILKRVLLIYRECMRRYDAQQALPAEVLPGAANMIRTFIEAYHEKLEENQLFPRFRKAGTLVDLVDVLETQHRKGRVLTDTILRLAEPGFPSDPKKAANLRQALHLFVAMYEPHEAREDTVLFPAFSKLVAPAEYDALGDEFENKERELFGEDGFERNVAEVARLEKMLGIYELSEFTPTA